MHDVAAPHPAPPIAGIAPQPNTNRKFSGIFKTNDAIPTNIAGRVIFVPSFKLLNAVKIIFAGAPHKIAPKYPVAIRVISAESGAINGKTDPAKYSSGTMNKLSNNANHSPLFITTPLRFSTDRPR
jgi:hypothetical protein